MNLCLSHVLFYLLQLFMNFHKTLKKSWSVGRKIPKNSTKSRKHCNLNENLKNKLIWNSTILNFRIVCDSWTFQSEWIRTAQLNCNSTKHLKVKFVYISIHNYREMITEALVMTHWRFVWNSSTNTKNAQLNRCCSFKEWITKFSTLLSSSKSTSTSDSELSNQSSNLNLYTNHQFTFQTKNCSNLFLPQ